MSSDAYGRLYEKHVAAEWPDSIGTEVDLRKAARVNACMRAG